MVPVLGTLRAVVRLFGLAGWTGGWALVWGTGAGLLILAPRYRSPWRRACFRRWARGLASILGMRIRTEGTPPAPPFLLVTNHLSYVDVVVLASAAPGIFVAKREVAGWPIWGPLARAMGTIFLDRARQRDTLRAAAEIDHAYRRGEGIILFAEGTSTDGRSIRPFKPALLESAARAGIPVSWARLAYRTADPDRPAHETVCWWGDMEFGPHLIDLCRLPEFEAKLAFGDAAIIEGDRKALAARLHRAVANRFVPSTS